MTFLDEQGVGPCGHSARDKGIFIKVYASCLSHQVPRQLAFSVRGCKNDKSSEVLIFCYPQEITNTQHINGIDATVVRCGMYFIHGKCLQMPQETWQTWKRICTVRSTDRGRKAWHVILTKDDESYVYLNIQAQSGQAHIDDHAKILMAGQGAGPTDQERASIIKLYVDGSLK